ncbi:MAG: hypothetical protein ACREQ9_19450, partial [Candidatus Binatia bacterium]
MRHFVRIAVVCALAAAPASRWLRHAGEGPDGRSREPSSLAAVRDRGELRLGVRRGTLSYFVHRGTTSGFEYELFERLASDLGVRLAVRVADSGRQAERWLRRGAVDAAVLPGEPTQPPGLTVVAPYVGGASGFE